MNYRRTYTKNMVYIATIVAIIFFIYYLFKVNMNLRTDPKIVNKENLKISPEKAEKIYNQAKNVFEEYGDTVEYSKYKNNVIDADPVQFIDIHKLYNNNNMSPQSIQEIYKK